MESRQERRGFERSEVLACGQQITRNARQRLTAKSPRPHRHDFTIFAGFGAIDGVVVSVDNTRCNQGRQGV